MKNRQRLLNISLILLSILASLKMIFFALGMDEEYQLVMAYRNAAGDRLFLDMWEPHQSSAFLCTLLMKPYLALFGTTGIVLYLRIWGTLLHLGISLYLYRVLKGLIEKRNAWLLALLYYNIIPKQIILPEFGIMQVWFLTLLTLFLLQYYIKDRKTGYLLLAALSLALNILSYPSCLILFPFMLFALFRLSGKNRWRDMGIFTLACGICGGAYLGMLFCHTTPGELLETLSHIVNGDITHSLSPADKALSFLQKALYEALLWGGCRLLAMAAAKWKKLDSCQIHCLTILNACAVQIFYWLVLDTGYESMHIHLIAVTIAGLSAYGKTKAQRTPPDSNALLNGISCEHASPEEVSRRDDSCASDRPNPGTLLRYCILAALVSLLAVVYLTDISLTESIPHAMPAAIYGSALLLLAFSDRRSEKGSPWIRAALMALLLTAVFGKGYTLRAGDYSNVLQSGGIMKEGPAAGTISNYIRAYVYNAEYENWKTYLQDGDKVLIVVNQVQSLGTIQYLFKDVEISHYSIVNPTPYDERLLEYWELYPEKAPNVIVVDCWYGELRVDPDSWIMNYIQEDFGYTKMEEGEYIRIYRK